MLRSEGLAGRSTALVVFGATGDLAQKMLLPALFELSRRGRLEMPVLGVALSDLDDAGFREHAREAVTRVVDNVDDAAMGRFTRSLRLVSGDYRDPTTYDRLATRLGHSERPAHYLAIPPSLFANVIEGLAKVGLNNNARVVVEKPFGRDLASARRLNRVLLAAFAESSVMRADHFLGKETVENLLVFRFANTFLEPLWNRNHISSVHVTMAEAFGIEGRGAFYDTVGAVRDVVQNHLMQVVAMLAMEPPSGSTAEELREERVKVVRAMQPVDPAHVVRGQYAGYRDEPGVAMDSNVETYVALRLDIESWRWAGVPFYVRAGKRLPMTALEAVIEFQPPPRMLFGGAYSRLPQPNLVRLRLGDGAGITMTVQAKQPGRQIATRPVDLSVDFDTVLGRRDRAYVRLLDDALDGDMHRFAREDMVEHAWRVVEPALHDDRPALSYQPGSWGPADGILSGAHWRVPEG